MRHRKLVFAAFLATFIGFATAAVEGQGQKNRQGEDATPNVTGRVTDLAGRSIRHAEITLYCWDSDEFVKATTNSFGYYRITGLKDGHAYMLVGVEHKRYLFLIAPLEFTVGREPLEFNFLGEVAR